MARIIDKDTRIIDIDFGPLTVTSFREVDEFKPTNITTVKNGLEQLLNILDTPVYGAGSFIQYQRLDLDFMARNNEVMMPVEVNVQRTSPVPLGFSINGNNADQIEEYIYILSAPLNNTNIAASTSTTNYEALRSIGLDRCQPAFSAIVGNANGNQGLIDQAQCIYAEKRMYSYNESNGASVNNGQLKPIVVPPLPPRVDYNVLMGMPNLDLVTTWGGMGAIIGPNLHCYRVVINRTQSFSPATLNLFVNQPLQGTSEHQWPPVNIRFLCKDPNFTEGEYLTRVANAMNQTAEGGPTA